MLKTRSKKIYRDIRAHLGRSVLVILSIMIGVFGVATMISITDLTNRQLAEDVKPSQISHTHVHVISGADSISPAENQVALDRISQLPGVVDVEGHAVYPVSWRKLGDNDLEHAFILASSERFGEGDLENISRLTAGRYPNRGEILVEQRFADANDIQLGDTLHFEHTGSEAWEVVGFAIHPFFTFAPAVDNTIQIPEKIFAHYEDAQRIVGFSGLSGIHVRYENTDLSLDGLDTLVEAVSRETPYVTVFAIHDNPDNNFLKDVMGQMTSAMDMLGLIAMVVSGFLVTNVMNTIVIEQRRQIGTMKSLGASFWDNVLIYAGMAVFYGVVGTLLGLLLATPVSASAARPIANWASAYIDGLKLSPVGLGVGAVMGIFVPVLAALIPVWLSTRISIFDALMDRGISSLWGQSRLSRAIGRLPLPISILQALSNIWRKKGRLTLTGMTLTVAVGAFMGANALAGSLDRFIENAFDIYGYEIRISPQRAQDYDQLAGLIMDSGADVQAVYPGFDVSVGVEGFVSSVPLSEGSNQVSAYGFDPATPTFSLDLLEGDGWQHDPTRRGVVISQSVASSIGKHAGDILTMTVGGQTFDYEIIGVQDFGFDFLYMDWRELATIVGFVDDSGQPIARTVYVDLAGKPSINAVDDQIDIITAAFNEQGIQANYHNQPEAAQIISEQAGVLGIIFTLMSIVMAAVGAVGLMAALSMAVFERQKEIGVMRSIGAQSRTIMGQFVLEGVLVGFIAWVIALPLSVAMGLSMMTVIPFDFVDFIYPPELLVVGLVGVIVIAAIASIWPSVMASRRTVADILRYQ